MPNALDIWKQMDRMFDTNTRNAFVPACEVTEDKNAYLVKFDVPGMSKDQIKIDLHENQLTVSGERKEERKEDSKRYHFTEVSYGSFLRTFSLPPNIDAEKVEAKLDNGVLTVSVAKAEASKARTVSIK